MKIFRCDGSWKEAGGQMAGLKAPQARGRRVHDVSSMPAQIRYERHSHFLG